MVLSKEEILKAGEMNELRFLWRDKRNRKVLVFCGSLPSKPSQGFLLKYNLGNGCVDTQMKHRNYRDVTKVRREGLSDEGAVAFCRNPREHTEGRGKVIKGKDSWIDMDKRPFQLGAARRVEIMEEKLQQQWSSIAIGDSGCLICLRTGRHWRIGNIPQKLQDKLRFAEYEKLKVVYCAIGSKYRHFMRCSDGTRRLYGNDEFRYSLRNSGDRTAVCVTFGSTMDSYFILYDDGTSDSSGLPDQLETLLSQRDDVQTVSLGWHGEWFVKFKKYWKCHHFSEEIRERLEQYKEDGAHIENIIFGKDTFVIQYSEADD